MASEWLFCIKDRKEIISIVQVVKMCEDNVK